VSRSPEAKQFRNNVKVSERHGAGEWTAERLSSLILVPLTIWALWSGWTLADAGYDAALEWFGDRINAIVLAATLLIAIWHMQMGIKVIVDDYIHRPTSSRLLLGLNALVCLLLAAAVVFFITRLAVGSAPLPAGLGG
jgi:succinate dehydrogenase / fumarate reductase membrane anchor subunit